MSRVTVQRAFDASLALIGLSLTLPLGILIAAAILAENGPPVLYRQRRVGMRGRGFTSFKFRSMRRNAEAGTGPIQSISGDGRITRVGRILRGMALDELPQLANILRGDMSFVGPRALRPIEIEAADAVPRSIRSYPGFEERCRVRPGLTGIAQLLLPRDASRGSKFRHDIWYVRNRSLRLDLLLLQLSLLVTVRRRWESSSRKLDQLGTLDRRIRTSAGG
jgi:lipopolysaccharide/colanic/teichoic acid biosynthesis glycosyltransferase